MRHSLAGELDCFLCKRNNCFSVLPEKTLASRNLPAMSKRPFFFQNLTNPSGIFRIVAHKAVPQTARIADEHFKKSDQVYVALLGVLASETPHPYSTSLRVDDLRPPCKSDGWVTLQTWVETHNLLVCAENVAVEQQSDYLFTDVRQQFGRVLGAHQPMLPLGGQA